MRLSLRTLLAFEDNVFDVEQHRRLEQLLPADKNAEATLRRIRAIVRNPSLGVPGLVDQQEELDPNYVAEYLDHQMSGSVQEKFEAYCLSADKYLAEIASVHHILSNVLGEPARTSRECRLKCYNVLSAPSLGAPSSTLFAAPEPPTHFMPHGSSAIKTDKPSKKRYFASLWNRLFLPKPVPPKSVPTATPVPEVPTEKKSPLWTFCILGMFIGTLLLSWQQIEKFCLEKKQHEHDAVAVEREPEIPQREAKTVFPKITLPTTENAPITENENANKAADETVAEHITEATDVAESPFPAAPLESFASIEQVAYTSETLTPFTVKPMDDPIEESVGTPPIEFTRLELSVPTDNVARDSESEQAIITKNIKSEALSATSEEETIVAFQPITTPTRSASELAFRQNVQMPPSSSVWQPPVEEQTTPVAPVESFVPVAAVQHPLPDPPRSAELSATVVVPRVFGRAVQASPQSLIFSAASSNAPWQLPPLPFDLNGNQYLLTVAPYCFRGTFELSAGFRIEMIGDAKLCILSPDSSGTPGIFVDYGRIIIHPLQANQPLRIETEKARGIVRTTGTESVLFIDTFAEVTEPWDGQKQLGEQRGKTSPILGFVPKNGERIVWQSAGQPQPFYITSQGCLFLQSERYRFAQIRLPNWLEVLPVSREDSALAEVCRRYFAEAHSDGEKALTRLIQDESPAARTLGLRLWGDLGRFDVPIAVIAERRQGEEAIRHVLNQYFEEVMRRDEETIQRLADAIETVKKAQREPVTR